MTQTTCFFFKLRPYLEPALRWCISKEAPRSLLTGLLLSTLWLGLWFIPNPAQAACAVGACVEAGPRLASVNTSQGALTNALLGNLLGTGASLNVLDWTSVAQADLSAVRYVSALQTGLGVSTPDSALTANATPAQLFTAAASVAQADGNTAAASSLNGLATQVSGLSGSVKLGDLLNVGLPSGSLTTTKVNAFDLVTGVAQLYNYRNVATTPTPITLSGSSLGLGSVINSVQLYAQVIEPPVFVCGPSGSTFHTAAIRVKLDLNLVNLTPGVGLLTVLLGVSTASINIGQLGLYLDVARADGSIGLINAISNAVSIQATPGVADLYLGSIPDATFFNRTRSLNAATDLGYGNIGTVTINGTSVGLLARSYARGQAPFATTLNFTGPYPQRLTASTSANFLNNLVTSLITNLDVALSPTLGLLNAVVLPVVKTIVGTTLSPLLGTLLTGLVDPLLALIGVHLGEVDITVTGVALSCPVSGTVYQDGNHNASLDGNETGTGLTLYAKIVLSTQAAGPAVQSIAVDPTTGRYTLPGVGVGSYTLLIDTNNTGSDITPGVTAGWLGTDYPSLIRTSVAVSNLDVTNQNFGLYNGARLTGTVFSDQGTSGGIANNGIRESNELGIGGSTLRVTDASGNTVYDTTQTLGTGAYTVFIPASVGATPIRLRQTNAPGWVSTGASLGNTAGTYDRNSDALSFTATAGTAYSAVDFSDVPDNSLQAASQRTALPGTVVFHPQRWTARTVGQVSFSTSGTATPATPGWQQVIYLDSNCDGTLQAGELAYTAALTTAVDQTVCLLVKTTVPAGAPYDAQYSGNLSANFTFTNASPALNTTYTVAELTTVARASDAALKLSKTVDKATARSGDLITYTITYRNDSSQPLANLKINDVTPRYTTFSNASCGALATGLTACSLSAQPSVGSSGNLEWTFTGTLQPGASASVNFAVVLQ